MNEVAIPKVTKALEVPIFYLFIFLGGIIEGQDIQIVYCVNIRFLIYSFPPL